MKAILFSLALLISFNNFSYDLSRIESSLSLVDAGYWGGDDGVECWSGFYNIEIYPSVFPDAIEVFYSVSHRYEHGCYFHGNINCKILLTSKEFHPIEESLECDPKEMGR